MSENNGIGVEADVSFRAKLGSMLTAAVGHAKDTATELRRQTQLMQQAAALQPITYRGRAQAIAAGGTVVLDLGGPSMGRTWELRHLVIGSDLPSTAAAGAVWVYRYAGGAAQVPAALSMFDAVDWNDTLPAKSTYGAGEITIGQTERLFVVVTGATNGQDYQAAFTVTDRLNTPTERTSMTV